MKLTENDILRNSFVITTSDEKLNRFYSVFKDACFEIMPKPYFGRYVDRKSDEYRFNRHYIGAHSSHFELCDIATRNGMDYILIFEDDAIPCNGIHEKLERYLKDIPDDAYILKLGYVPFDGFKYKDRKLDDIECITDDKYSETYFGGSHSYIIFKKFFEKSYECYKEFLDILKYKDVKSIHNPMFFKREMLDKLWMYEWLMTPNVYKNHELQKHIYSVNPNENLFSQPYFITRNEETERYFDI